MPRSVIFQVLHFPARSFWSVIFRSCKCSAPDDTSNVCSCHGLLTTATEASLKVNHAQRNMANVNFEPHPSLCPKWMEFTKHGCLFAWSLLINTSVELRSCCRRWDHQRSHMHATITSSVAQHGLLLFSAFRPKSGSCRHSTLLVFCPKMRSAFCPFGILTASPFPPSVGISSHTLCSHLGGKTSLSEHRLYQQLCCLFSEYRCCSDMVVFPSGRFPYYSWMCLGTGSPFPYWFPYHRHIWTQLTGSASMRLSLSDAVSPCFDRVRQ